MNTRIKFFGLLFFFTAALLSAQVEKYENEPGYVDFGDLSIFETEDETVEVLVEQKYLKMVSKFAGENEPEIADLINGLKLIKVTTFKVNDKNRSGLYKKIGEISSRLKHTGWDQLVRVKSSEEKVGVFMKSPDGDKISGLAITVIEENGDAVFLNIVGAIDLEKIGKLSNMFGIPSLSHINDKNDEVEENEK